MEVCVDSGLKIVNDMIYFQDRYPYINITNEKGFVISITINNL